MATRQQSFGIEVRFAFQLHDAARDQIRVSLFFVRVLQKFCRDALSIDAGSHKIMPFISQYTDEFGGQSLVQDLYCRLSIARIALRYRSVFDMFACALAQSLNVCEKWF